MLTRRLALKASAALALSLLGAAGCSSRFPGDPSGAAGDGSEAAETEPSGTIDVWVLDRTFSSIPGAAFDDYRVTTDYRYDGSGRAVESTQSTNLPDSPVNLCTSTYSYDGKGRLTDVTRAYEQYDWNVGDAFHLAYDGKGRCSTYRYEIVSQGIGEYEISYDYGDEGRIESADAEFTEGPGSEPDAARISWEYFENGMIRKVASNGSPSFAGPGFAEELSDPRSGLYAYRDRFGTTTILQFDDAGRLTSRSATSPGGGIDQMEYEYKKISVRADGFIPTVISNPTGFDLAWAPQLSPEQAASVMEG